MRSTIAYTTARILLFVAATGLLYVAGLRGMLLLGVALLVSGLASYVLLSRQRDAMSGALTARLGGVRGRVSDLRTRLDEGTRAEDLDEPEPATAVAQPAPVAGSGEAAGPGETAGSGEAAGPGEAAQARAAQSGPAAEPGRG